MMCVMVVVGSEFQMVDDAYINQPQRDVTTVSHKDVDIFGKISTYF